MPTIGYVQPDGSRREVQAPAGTSVMKNAVLNDVPGIVAECGGSLMCATCHVYVDPADAERLPALSDDEDEMLEVAAAERRETSRLSCQLTVDESLDGLTVHVPEAQA
ncbi:2Fe-2S iron-sulfur cluster-binding protein [Geodermatophilus normandii]|uniref:2Fe-2S iron-sulfur cluster binding domain-containing protein n=1 Tax=Geodermatophilus normandii TaxID=1137989 RepID=A0A6P0GNM1_9ACTN|nr:2Fe-2S iron-sulfur cluster-binding protein [Geodermatophilus normandii]NEM08900.1 2Fe-2S iron-sulfur cluster binding domain-containing protein [Geodermatophilus normandii]